MQLKDFLDKNPYHKGCTTWEEQTIRAEIDKFLVWISSQVSQDLLANLTIQYENLERDDPEIPTDNILCFVQNNEWFIYRVVLDQRNDWNNHTIDFFENCWTQEVSKNEWDESIDQKIVELFFEEIFDKLSQKICLTDFEEYQIWLTNRTCKKLIKKDWLKHEIYIFNLQDWHSIWCVIKYINQENYLYNFFISTSLRNNI